MPHLMEETFDMRVTLLVQSPCFGGTERQVLNLASGLRSRAHEVSVVMLFEEASLEQLLREAAVDVVNVKFRGRLDLPRLLGRVVPSIATLAPELVYGFNVHANVLAVLSTRVLRRPARIVWGIRTDDAAGLAADTIGRLGARVEPLFARFVDLAISNSRAGLRYAIQRGVPPERARLIGNGIDTTVFAPNSGARERVRTEWGVANDAVVVGTAARLDPRKGHHLFLHAARVFAESNPSARFACIGNGDRRYRDELHTLAREVGVAERIVWTGTRMDMPAVYNALDVATLLSTAEGSSNAVAEALACGVPCVVTDVGESGRIVGDPELIVNEDPRSVAAAWEQARRRPPAARAATRVRIGAEFGLDAMVGTTEAALAGLL